MKLIRDKVKEEVYMCKKVCDMAERGDLRADYVLQREADQWDKADRDNFIVTVLLNEDFDAIKICEELTPTGVTLWIIDGLQKYGYISGFKAGAFRLGKNIDPEEITYQEAKRDENGKIIRDEYDNIVYEEVTFNLKNKGYKDLPAKLKENFDDCPVKIVKHLDCTPEEMARHLRRYNRGAKMKPAQILLTRMLNVGRQIKELSTHDFWSDRAMIKDSNRKNGKVNQLMAEIVMGLNFWEDWTRNTTKLGEYLNENATDEVFENSRKILDDLMDITTVQIGEKLFSEKNILIWVMFFDQCLKNGIPKEVYGKFLNNFDSYNSVKVELDHEYKIVKGSDEMFSKVTWNELDESKSTKDRGIIEDKLHILHTLMNKFLEDNGIKIASQDEENINTVEEVVETVELPEAQEETETENVVEPGENTVVEDESDADKAEDAAGIDDPKESIPEDELVEFVKQNTELNVDSEDIGLYKDLIEDTVPVTSPLYQKCYKALIAMMAKTCEMDKDDEFSDWVQKHKNDNANFSNSQRVNYLYFMRDFDKYVAAR
jgi:hypothetical protein|nr:MAG TPA: hypothetical protein [Bacteriophage sp.]